MKTVTLLGLFVLLTHISGCNAGTVSEKYMYTKAKAQNVENMVIINKPLAQVWKGVIKFLSNKQYRVHRIAENRREINFDFQADTAADVEKYVDCGSSTRIITYQDKSHSYHYSLAGSQPYKTVSKDKENFLYDVSPHMQLSGTVDMSLSALNARQTKIHINARYAMTRSLSIKFYQKDNKGHFHEIGDFGWEPIRVQLTTKEPGLYAENSAVRCMATGALEGAFLRGLNKTNYASN